LNEQIKMNKKLLAFLFISTLAFAAAKKKAVVEEQLEETKNKGK